MATGGRFDDVYAGWLVVAGCFLGSFVVFGLSYSFGVFFDPVLEAFGAPRSTTSTAFGVQTVALYVGAVGVGALVDRYGPRRALAAAALVLCAGLLATSRTTSLPAFVLTYGVVTGAGLSVVFVVAYATPARWFDRRVGLASGLASAGLGVGMLVVSPAAAALVARVGWRDALVWLAVGVAVALGAATALVREDPGSGAPPAGEFPDGVDTDDARTLRALFDAVAGVARTPAFALTFLGWIAVFGSLYVVLVNLVVYGTDVGLSRTAGATALSVLGAASAAGRVAIGFFGDRLGRVRVFVACSAAMGAFTAALAAVDSALGLWTFAAAFGLAYGGNGALLAPLTAHLFGRANINAVFGLVSTSFAVSGLVAPYLAGVGYESFGSYDPVFAATGAVAVAGALAVFAADRTRSE
ncbi:MFS transporter [Halobacterium yunchengense]|uniref:MFS transporter n=1 Tax=Halobacterium yunchengense TaxID=3108497 RepID=UPI0030091CB7